LQTTGKHDIVKQFKIITTRIVVKKAIALGAIMISLSTNNISGMLRCIKHAAPRRALIQQRFHVSAQPKKNLFNINTNSEPKENVYGYVQDLCDRNLELKELLIKLEQNAIVTRKTLDWQSDVAFNHVKGYSLQIGKLTAQERILKNLYVENLSLSAKIQQQASSLDIKAKAQGHADE
jgi:hypothetical protein